MKSGMAKAKGPEPGLLLFFGICLFVILKNKEE